MAESYGNRDIKALTMKNDYLDSLIKVKSKDFDFSDHRL